MRKRIKKLNFEVSVIIPTMLSVVYYFSVYDIHYIHDIHTCMYI